MKKNITKEQIITTALDLIKNRTDLRSLNLREIARTLGCAHTNLYNYFSCYDDLLWEMYTTLLGLFLEKLTAKLETAKDPETKLTYFFQTFVDLYMDNKGWFRLAWHDYIGNDLSRQNSTATEAANSKLNECISELWKELSGEYPSARRTKRVLHNTHCYIVGEVSNYLASRRMIENESDLKAYITREAVNMFRLCLKGA